MHLVNDDVENTKWFVHNGLLARFRKGSVGINYWKEHWQDDRKRQDLEQRAKHQSLGQYEEIFQKYIDKDGLTIEAGCGTGYVAEILRVRGYNVIGLDYEEEVIEYARKLYPELKVEVGDITNLRFPSGSVKTYISLGVLEHFESGSGPSLKEARRVLDKDGVALISVPYLNPSRKAYLNTIAPDDPSKSQFRFYQYYFAQNDFETLLNEHGFDVVEKFALFPLHFLHREHPGFRKFWASWICRQSLKNLIKRNENNLPNKLLGNYAHMIMYACRIKS